MLERRLVAIEGTVQGVGFRPFVHGLATTLGLRGSVRNEAGRVLVDVEGAPTTLDEFLRLLAVRLPAPASIARVRVRRDRARGCSDFRIADSGRSPLLGPGTRTAARPGARVIAPDIATCARCLSELFDPADRRHRYPFISCSQCGPRFGILVGIPYDRARTTMRAFDMCATCRREYEDPRDRRFHAQANACATCGPRVTLTWPHHIPRNGTVASHRLHDEDALAQAVSALRDGAILAVKGIGGYHLACDATSGAAVRRLRQRKGREARPFAVMVCDLAMAESIAVLGDAERDLLASASRPIVLLPPRPAPRGSAQAGLPIAAEVGPGVPHVGILLPYTPLHHLLLRDTGLPLVMTSGNRSEEPIATDDDEAAVRLSDIADGILSNDREIAAPCDDSVVRVIGGSCSPLRLGRGMLPAAIRLPVPARRPVLALGGQLKNAICVAAGPWAHPSPHVGNLESAAALMALRRAVARQVELHGVVPEVVAHDLHPDYASTHLAQALASGADPLLERAAEMETLAVQHHHAHVASCVAEHGVVQPVLGVAFDGTGYGTDGAVWGGEFLAVDGATVSRVAHLQYVPLPGGDAAAREPWRMAVAHLWSAFGEELERLAPASLELVQRPEWPLLRQMLARGVQSPPTSSVGRLFDAVAALTTVRTTSRFEGDAAMALEGAADPGTRRSYPVEPRDVDGTCVLDTAPLIRGVVSDLTAGVPVPQIAGAFHTSLARMIGRVAREVRERTGIRHVALTGGVFQNGLLTGRATALLEEAGFAVLRHQRVPCGDGGIAVGQAMVAALRDAAPRGGIAALNVQRRPAVPATEG